MAAKNDKDLAPFRQELRAVSLKTLVAGQAKIMEHLGITADNGDASRN